MIHTNSIFWPIVFRAAEPPGGHDTGQIPGPSLSSYGCLSQGLASGRVVQPFKTGLRLYYLVGQAAGS